MAKRRAKRRYQVAREAIELVNQYAAQHSTYREDTVVDLSNELGGGRQKTYKVLRNIYPTIVDRWLAEGGPGFEEPSRRAIEHCRRLWRRVGSHSPLVANLDGVGGGGGRERGLEQAEALATLAQYERRIPAAYWDVFEDVVRHDIPVGTAAAHFGSSAHAHAKNCVGFVASLIAQWRGY